MNDRMYDQLKEAIQIEYEENLDALEKLRGLLGRRSPNGAPAVALASRKPKAHSEMSEEERKEQKRAYMRAWYAKKHGKPMKAPRNNDVDGKGLSPAKFKKFLVKGPAAAGGTGEDD